MATTDAHELAEYEALYLIEPWGDLRADLRQAITSMVIANVNRGKNQRAFKVEDFMPIREPKKKQTWQEMQFMLRQLCEEDK